MFAGVGAEVSRAFTLNSRQPLKAFSTRVVGVDDSDTFSVAPMMDYTDRHLRFLFRLISKRAKLYSEMVTANTLVHNEDLARWLDFSEQEHPVVLQLGGNEAGALAQAVSKALPWGYDEFNLNCGCPSEKVAGAGAFGAALMEDPEHVARLCCAMGDAAKGGVPVTVKCRIGVLDKEEMGARLDVDEEADYERWGASWSWGLVPTYPAARRLAEHREAHR